MKIGNRQSAIGNPPTFRRFWLEQKENVSLVALAIWVLASTFLNVWLVLPFLIVLAAGFAASVLFIVLAYWAWREHEEEAALNAVADSREDEPLKPWPPPKE